MPGDYVSFWKVHYFDAAKEMVYTACGRPTWGRFEVSQKTDDVEEVNCKSCLKTKIVKEMLK